MTTILGRYRSALARERRIELAMFEDGPPDCETLLVAQVEALYEENKRLKALLRQARIIAREARNERSRAFLVEEIDAVLKGAEPPPRPRSHRHHPNSP